MSFEGMKLEEIEQLQLQNIMLKLTIEAERVEKYKAQIAEAEGSISGYYAQIEGWKEEYNKKLIDMGLNLKDVTIDAETGLVSPATPLTEVVEPVSEKAG